MLRQADHLRVLIGVVQDDRVVAFVNGIEAKPDSIPLPFASRRLPHQIRPIPVFYDPNKRIHEGILSPVSIHQLLGKAEYLLLRDFKNERTNKLSSTY